MQCLVLFRFARFALSGPVSGFVRPGTQSARPKTMEQVNVFSTNRNYFPNYFAAENDYGGERPSAPPFLTHPHTPGPPPIRTLTHSPIRANTCNSRLSRPAGPGPPPRRSSLTSASMLLILTGIPTFSGAMPLYTRHVGGVPLVLVGG